MNVTPLKNKKSVSLLKQHEVDLFITMVTLVEGQWNQWLAYPKVDVNVDGTPSHEGMIIIIKQQWIPLTEELAQNDADFLNFYFKAIIYWFVCLFVCLYCKLTE